MTKEPHIKYAKICAYIPPEYKAQVETHAKEQGLSVASWLRKLMESETGIDFGMTEQIPDGTSKRRKP